jgi:hypothetical protein
MSNELKPNYPAFSKAAFYHPDGGCDGPNEGLTAREYFAAKAMQSFIITKEGRTLEYVARVAVVTADELIKALNKEP